MVAPDAAPNLGAGLLNYWPLDTVNDLPSPTTPDLYSHDDLALIGLDSSSLVTGVFSNALAFSGGQYGQRVGGFPIYLATNYTISLWVNGSPQTDTRVYSEGSDVNNNPLFTIGTDNTGATPSAAVYIRTDAGTAVLNHAQTTRAVFDGTWHHLVWVDQGGQAKVYVDGVLDETSFGYARGSLTLDTSAIGAVLRAGAGNYFIGTIDEVSVWNRALNWTEIEEAYSAPVPAPVGSLAPAIFTQPADQTNFVFATSSFSVVTSGSQPLSYQWQMDGTNIPAALNPTATNRVLELGGLLPPTAAGGYSVIVTNTAGTVTSRVAQLSLVNGPMNVEFDQAASTTLQPGFAEMTLSAPSATIGGIFVTISAIGGIALADRNRNAAPMVTNIPPFLTQAQLYDEFIFGNDAATLNAGIDILIQNLVPNTNYGVTIWSFDPVSGGARVSDWTEVASGTTIPVTTGYTFDGTVLPAYDYEYTLGGLLTSSATGRLEIQGVKTGTDSFCVFINALRVEANPLPTSQIVSITTATNGYVQFVATGRYPGQPIDFQQNTNLLGGTWVPAAGGIPLWTNGMVTAIQFPMTGGPLFYRAVTP